MKTATQQLDDLITITQHSNERYRSQLSSTYTRQLILLLRELRDIIRVEYDQEDTSKPAQIQLQKKLDKKLKSGLDKIYKELDVDLNGFMRMNNKLYNDQLKAVFEPVKDFIKIKPTKTSDIIDSYNKDQMTFDKSGAHTVSSLWKTFTARLNTIVKQTVDQAYLLEQSTRDFESEIYGITANTNVSKGNLDAVIGSFVGFGFASVIKGNARSNVGILRGYSWNSIIDTATSEICLDFNGRYYLYDFPDRSTLPYEVYAPVHHRCRSSNPPIVKTYQELGISPDELTTEQKQLLGKPNLEPFSYQQFVENQPTAVQKELLGQVRYDMWKKGEIEISQFYTRDGRKYSLAQLQRRGYEISQQYLHYIRR